MRLAWFRDMPVDCAAGADETAPCIALLGQTHEIDVFTAATAHDFVWKQQGQPYDLCIYEYPHADQRSFMRAYATHYPGLTSMPGDRPRGWGVPGPWLTHDARRPDGPVRFGLIGTRAATVLAAAEARVRDLGVPIEILHGDAFDVIARSDVVLALTWPSAGESLMPALAAMAAGKPTVVYELEATAGWPALDPQTWRPRDPSPAAPAAVVSIDVRDEAHSLLLVLRRLATDPTLRERLGAAAHAWWRDHGTVEGAARAWERLMTAAAASIAEAPAVAIDAPDGADYARRVLTTFGLPLPW